MISAFIVHVLLIAVCNGNVCARPVVFGKYDTAAQCEDMADHLSGKRPSDQFMCVQAVR